MSLSQTVEYRANRYLEEIDTRCDCGRALAEHDHPQDVMRLHGKIFHPSCWEKTVRGRLHALPVCERRALSRRLLRQQIAHANRPKSEVVYVPRKRPAYTLPLGIVLVSLIGLIVGVMA